MALHYTSVDTAAPLRFTALRFRVENNSPAFQVQAYVALHCTSADTAAPLRFTSLRFRVENNSPCFSGAIIFAMIEEHIYVERIVL